METTYRALILDDDDLIRNLMVDALASDTNTAWIVTTSESAEDTWKKFKSGLRYEVASIDIRLGGRSGIELIEMMQKEKVPVPVVVVSGTVDAHTVLKCLEMGAADYVIKPFEIRSYRGAMTRTAELYKGGYDYWSPVDLVSPVTDWVEVTA